MFGRRASVSVSPHFPNYYRKSDKSLHTRAHDHNAKPISLTVIPGHPYLFSILRSRNILLVLSIAIAILESPTRKETIMSVLAKDLFILKRLPQGALTDHLLHEVAAALIAGEAR